jgi:hypothetical protein
MSDMRVDDSLQKKKEKNNKYARIPHIEIWDTLFSHFPHLHHLGLSGGNKNIFPPRQNPYGHAGSRRENDIKSVRVQ